MNTFVAQNELSYIHELAKQARNTESCTNRAGIAISSTPSQCLPPRAIPCASLRPTAAKESSTTSNGTVIAAMAGCKSCCLHEGTSTLLLSRLRCLIALDDIPCCSQ